MLQLQHFVSAPSMRHLTWGNKHLAALAHPRLFPFTASHFPSSVMSENAIHTIEGLSTSEQDHSHRSFELHRPGSAVANVQQVLLLDDVCLIYHVDACDGVSFPLPGSEGAILLGTLDNARDWEVRRIISRQSPPRNGRDRVKTGFSIALLPSRG